MFKNIEKKDILEEIVRRLIKAYAPYQIYLFGSFARGEEQADSDFDLLIIVPDDASLERRKSRLAYHSLRGTGIAVDVLVFTKSAFNQRLHLRASLPSIVKDEGKLLYAA